MVELVYFLLTKLFDAYKDAYPTKIKFTFDTFFLIYTFFSVIVYMCTQLSINMYSFKNKASNLNFILVGYESL